MKTKTFKVLSSALLLSSSLSATNVFDGDYAFGLVGQGGGEITPFENKEFTLEYKSTGSTPPAASGGDAAASGGDAATPDATTTPAATESKKYALSKDLDYPAGLGIKFLANLDEDILLDVSLTAKKYLGTNAVKIGAKAYDFKSVDGIFDNMDFELNVGMLYNVMDLSEDSQLYAGAGALINYKLIDKNLVLGEDQKLPEEAGYNPEISETTKFNKAKLSGGVYGTLQAMFKASDSVLVGAGVKLHVTAFNSDFGDISDTSGIDNTNVYKAGLSGLLFVTYVV